MRNRGMQTKVDQFPPPAIYLSLQRTKLTFVYLFVCVFDNINFLVCLLIFQFFSSVQFSYLHLHYLYLPVDFTTRAKKQRRINSKQQALHFIRQVVISLLFVVCLFVYLYDKFVRIQGRVKAAIYLTLPPTATADKLAKELSLRKTTL